MAPLRAEGSEGREYLGDGVYVRFNKAQQLVLTTEDGISVTNEIYLEAEVYHSLVRYVDRLRHEAR